MSIRRRGSSLAVLLFLGLVPLAADAQEAPPPAPAPAPAAAPTAPTAPAAPAAPVAPAKPPKSRGRKAIPGECLQFAGDTGPVGDALGGMTFAIGDAPQTLAEVRFVGLTTLTEERVWQLVGGRPEGTNTLSQAAVLVARLAQSGLFAKITPAVKLSTTAGGGATLELTLVEHVTVRAIEITGLGELTREELTDALFLVPPAGDDDDDDSDDDDSGDDASVDFKNGRLHVRSRHREPETRIALRCPPPRPPREWTVRMKDGRFHAGIVWGGLPEGLRRAQRWLRGEGYLLGRVSATLTADGTRHVAVDEGTPDGVVVEGVHDSLRPEVLRLLGLDARRPFNVEDLRIGRHAVEKRYPFLRPAHGSRPAMPGLELADEDDGAGGRRYAFHEVATKCTDDDDDRDVDFGWDDLTDALDRLGDDDFDDDDRDRDDCGTRSTWYELRGRQLVVHLRFHRVDFDGDALDLIRHTPVTGYAPGFLLSLRAWDRADRVHFRFDTQFNLNTRTASIPAVHDGALAELAAAERIDVLVAPSLSVPSLGLAELGVEGFALTDSEDDWRVTRLDSYLNSALFGRAERDFYRRAGVGAFVTFHVLDQLTFGGEYRFERQLSLAKAKDTDTIFTDGDDRPNPAIAEGLYGTLLLRAEWATRGAGFHDVDANARRRPVLGTWIDRDGIGRAESGLRTIATFELADPSLGGAAKYWRASSDSVLSLATGNDQGVSLRVRVSGGHDLPLGKQEALGGWGSLRGYDFKEYAGGDVSLLSSLEYRFDAISLFVDAGAVRAPGGDFEGPRLGLGTALNLGDSGQLAFAWRTDEDAEAVPEIRLLFGRPW
jgi:hypothetical protein